MDYFLKNKTILLALTEEEVTLINNALCVYGYILDCFNTFDIYGAISFKDGKKVAELMDKIGEEL